MSTNFYPTEMRATGTGWVTFFGRLGGISGASVGAVLLAFHLTMGEIFWFMCLPIGVGILASYIKGRVSRSQAASGAFVGH
jgi:AAHS family 4-hydroxybenzoate transporter-like MFS transporter